MIYKKLEKEVWVEYEPETKKVSIFDKEKIKEELLDLKERLKAIPKPLTDKELLAWAKENYQAVDYSVEEQSLTSSINLIEERLESIKQWQ